MDSFQFRPTLHTLEDRLTPSDTPPVVPPVPTQPVATPFEVFQAIEQTREAQQQIADILKYFSGPVNVYAQSYFATMMPSLVDASVRSAVVLNEFHAALASQIQTSPDSSFFARELIGGAGANLSVAYSNATQAETTGVGLGAAPYVARHPEVVPPVAPPVTPPTAPGAPVLSRDRTGMTETIPSLTAPEWRDIGEGLRVWDVNEGVGTPVAAGESIEIHYTGWLRDGTIFDSTISRNGDPITFDLDNLIVGWQRGIPGMKPGGIRRLDIPSEIAYGERGSPPSIPANADLVFEIKLVPVQDRSGMTDVLPSLTDSEWVSVGTQGLRVWDVVEGTGPIVQAGQQITIHYTGWRRDDGTVVDSTIDESNPQTVDLADRIDGWQQGIPGMRAGGIRRLDIPASLAFGATGDPSNNIPANADLVYEIKLFESSDPEAIS